MPEVWNEILGEINLGRIPLPRSRRLGNQLRHARAPKLQSSWDRQKWTGTESAYFPWPISKESRFNILSQYLLLSSFRSLVEFCVGSKIPGPTLLPAFRFLCHVRNVSRKFRVESCLRSHSRRFSGTLPTLSRIAPSRSRTLESAWDVSRFTNYLYTVIIAMAMLLEENHEKLSLWIRKLRKISHAIWSFTTQRPRRLLSSSAWLAECN